MTNFQKAVNTPMIKKSSYDKKIKISAQHIHMSASKVRRVIDQIRGRSYEETLLILGLKFMPYRACYLILKLIYSAVSSNNMNFNEVDLFISKAEVNKSTIVKKFRPRARGRSYMIKRPTCHITIELREKSKSLLDQSII
uniref:ribosomal protein L22 n=1 Tax=Xyris indica TaxID=2919641 RepID=UPI001F135FE2|nr:ribosomal protein L22 [Xyris indica]ULQ68362.1 ribosomal protein L22 [Xyris indica]ULQ68442.1 ribosomal protein L22 [Xyris indica]ULQ68679.1 ribosomal protein L22 [Xyris indica]